MVVEQERSKPVLALAELIWNAFDADARTVKVSFERDDAGEPQAVMVEDDGDGIPHADAAEFFRFQSDSWKKTRSQTRTGRFLHGRDGCGRFKAFALGRVAEWAVVYRRDGELWAYTIRVSAHDLREVRISDETVATGAATPGVIVTIRELIQDLGVLAFKDGRQALTEVFAIYLSDARNNACIVLDGRVIDSASAMAGRKSFSLTDITIDGREFWVRLHLIEWDATSHQALYLCNQRVFPLMQVDRPIQIGLFQFSAYLYSPYFDLALQADVVAATVAEAQHVIRTHFRLRAAEEARSVVEEWKHDAVYPFANEPVTPIERVERQVFDIVAVNVARYLPDFGAIQPTTKAFQLRMLRQAIERSPAELQLILGEVLRLPRRQQEELARLLRDTIVSSIIGAAKVVSDRLKFLDGLEAILFDAEPKRRLKERSQLHRIIAQNCWLFGDEFGLSVDDQSLTQALVAHKKLLDADIVIDEPVRHISQTRGIVDLMLSRATKHHRANRLSHLVVELKAPNVSIGPDEVTQIQGYAFSVIDDPRFSRVGVKWSFWVISDELKPYTEHLVKDETGSILEKPNVSIFAKTWAQVLDDNRARLKFLQDQLDIQADRGASLRYLQRRYATYLQGVFEVDDAVEDEDGLALETDEEEAMASAF